MSKKRMINSYQFMLLVILCYLGTSILVTPRSIALEAKQDAWLSSLLGILISFIIVWIYNRLGDMFHNMTLTQYTEEILGKWIGKFVSISFVVFALLNASMLLWFVGNFITTQILIETPIEITNTLFAIIIVMGTRLGLETFARAAEIMIPYVIGFILILVLFIIKDIEVVNMFPVLEDGLKPILRGSLSFVSYSSLTLIILMMIFPAYINQPNHAKKAFFRGVIIAGILMFIIIDLSTLVLGHELTARNAFPSYILAKKISLGEVLERVEVVIAVSWIVTIFYKVLLYFYGAVLGLAQILNLEDYKPLTLPLAMIMIVLSLIVYPNSTYADTWNSKTWIPFSLTYGFFLPIFLLVVGKLRKRSKDNR